MSDETDSDATDHAHQTVAPTLSLDGPYRALTPYRTTDAEVFFGRTELWRRLHVRAVPGGGIVTVLGPSGSGKTSLINAGLIPAVTRMGLRHNDTRVPAAVVVMTPGPSPVQTLAGALGVAPDTIDSLVTQPDPAESNPAPWTSAITAAIDPSAPAVLLVIDQAEELFTLCDRPTRSTFLAIVDTLANDPHFAVIAALQADFYARGMADPVLVRTLADSAVVVRMMTDDELIEAIERPAVVRGGGVEAGLAAEIVRDLASLDSTPVLVALGVLMDRLWQTRAGTTITTQAYRAVDPVADIVGTTAERTYTRLSHADQATARLILLSTIRFTDQGDLVRSGVSVDGLGTALRAHVRTDEVITALIDSELIVADDDDGTVRLRLTHDALVVSWPRLAGWVAGRRRSAAVIADLTADAESWEDGRRPESELYAAARFSDASGAVEEIDSISPSARDFLARSNERLSLRTSRRRVLLGALVVVAVVALVVAITSIVRGGDTDRDAAQLDATLARIAADTTSDPSAAAAAALDAYRDAPNDPRTRSAVLATQTSPIAHSLGGSDQAVAVAVSADGARAALVETDGAIRIVSTTASGETLSTVGAPNSAPGADNAVALSADGSLLARRSTGGAIEVWRLAGRDATQVARIDANAATGTAQQNTLAFSPVRPWLAAPDTTGSIRVWDIADPARPALITTVRTPSAMSVAWNPRAPQMLIGSGDQRVTLWDLSDPRAPRPRGPGVDTAGAVTGIAISPDGATAAVAEDSAATALFDVSARGLSPRGPGVSASSGAAQSVSFSPSGKRLAVTSADGAAQVWDITHADAPRPAAPALRSRSSTLAAAAFTGESTLVSAGSGAALAWSLPSGLLDGGFGGAYPPACSIARKACVTSYVDGPVQVWNATDPFAPKNITTIDVPGHLDGATMSPDGMWMMTVDSRHVAQLWDVRDVSKPVAIGAPLSLGAQASDHMVFSPSSGLLATSTGGGRSVLVSDVSMRGLAPVAILSNDAVVDAVAFGTDSRTVAVGGDDNAVRRWTLSDAGAEPIQGDLAIGHPVTVIAVVGPDLLVGDRSGEITRWTTTGAEVGTGVSVGSAAITSITAVGSGTAIASGDGTIRRLDTDGRLLDAGNLFARTANGDSRIAEITPTTVIVSGDTGRQQFWSVDPDAVAASLCTRSGADNC